MPCFDKPAELDILGEIAWKKKMNDAKKHWPWAPYTEELPPLPDNSCPGGCGEPKDQCKCEELRHQHVWDCQRPFLECEDCKRYFGPKKEGVRPAPLRSLIGPAHTE